MNTDNSVKAIENFGEVPDTVRELIDIVTHEKASTMDNIQYYNNVFLPKPLQLEQLKKDILETNIKINTIAWENEFKRTEPAENEILLFEHYCLGGITNNEYQQYITDFDEVDMKVFKTLFFKYGEYKPEQITLPKFELITDFLALLEYYNNLVEDFEKGERTPPPARNQLQTKLTDTQRGKLYELLVKNGFISGTTDKTGFIWAFGGESEKPNNWEPIEWIDKSVTRHEPNMQTLFELLYLLKIDNDTTASNPDNMYNKIRYIFKYSKDIASKNPYKAQQRTKRQKLLKDIIEEIDTIK